MNNNPSLSATYTNDVYSDIRVVNAATLTNALAWSNTIQKFEFCLGLLGMSRAMDGDKACEVAVKALESSFNTRLTETNVLTHEQAAVIHSVMRALKDKGGNIKSCTLDGNAISVRTWKDGAITVKKEGRPIEQHASNAAFADAYGLD